MILIKCILMNKYKFLKLFTVCQLMILHDKMMRIERFCNFVLIYLEHRNRKFALKEIILNTDMILDG